MTEPATRSGFVSLVGRPNSGKSTLLNRLVGEKVSIVTNKPQTTRNVIRGIVTRSEGQVVFLDTPGIHKPIHRMNNLMMKAVREAIEGSRRGGADDRLLGVFREGRSIRAGPGECDQHPENTDPQQNRQGPKPDLLPMIERYSSQAKFDEIIPMSALRDDSVEPLITVLLRFMPEGPLYYPEDQLSDRHERSIASEIIREKLIDLTEDELPYANSCHCGSLRGRREVASDLRDYPRRTRNTEGNCHWKEGTPAEGSGDRRQEGPRKVSWAAHLSGVAREGHVGLA
jgi:GTP-binding protein Era